MGGAMLSNSVIQFSVGGQGCVPSLLFDLRPNYGGGNEDNGNLLQKVHAMPHSVPSTPQQATANPCLRWRLLNTHRHIWLSHIWGHCSFLLGPGAHKVLFVSPKNLFPQSNISSFSSVVGLMVTSSKRAYVTPQSAAPRAPAPVAAHC